VELGADGHAGQPSCVNGFVFRLSGVEASAESGTLFVEVRNASSVVVATGSIPRSTANATATDSTITFASPFLAASDATYHVFMRTSTAVAPKVIVRYFETATLSVTNAPPVADAGPNQPVPTEAAVVLTGAGSLDTDPASKLTYLWNQTGGILVPHVKMELILQIGLVPDVCAKCDIDQCRFYERCHCRRPL
jgi:hypothetical protein